MTSKIFLKNYSQNCLKRHRLEHHTGFIDQNLTTYLFKRLAL